MHHHTITLKSPLSFPFHYHAPPPPQTSPQNPRHQLTLSIPTPPPRLHSFAFCCRGGIQLSATLHGASAPHSPIPAPWKLRSVGAKNVDVATLGNLCVDIVLNVTSLPPRDPQSRLAYMESLSKSPPDERFWEAGGNCNMVIAAARLGLHCNAIGHVGNEVYGKFLLDVLHDQGIVTVEMSEDADGVAKSPGALYQTLLCWVLVDPFQKHGFCSRADFSKEPAFSWLTQLSEGVKMAIKQSKVLFCNGYGFDELSPGVMVSAVDYAVEVGTSVFFDPGPRGKSLSSGTSDEQHALNHFLKMSDVLLLTSDEAESLTGVGKPILAGKKLLRNGVRTKWVIVKMGSRGSILITMSSIYCAPAFKVDVADTVGCGDSFVAAVAFGFIHGLSMVSTLAIANAVGAATATGCGAGRNVATLEKVMELIRAADIHENDEFWNELLVTNLDADEITCLSKTVINRKGNNLNHVPLQEVVSELLPKLESPRLKEKLVS